MTLDGTKARGGRWFDDIGKAKAASRLAKDARERVHASEPALFVLRMAHPSSLFAWEVRTYAAIVIHRGDGYATEALARAAGARALMAMPARSTSPEKEVAGAREAQALPSAADRRAADDSGPRG